ncbi:MAG TPA: hypothetical protein DCP90_02150 [Clostridiales bacterium]|nr:MAG: hypothetical protein A2Y22_08510 [Clostridiales bacterium GWD2_32_59]HAN09396.1 hypothetical protein [Clostridiales bacterium]
MKVNFVVQANGTEVTQEQMVNAVKEAWKNEGKMVKDIESMELFYKLEDGKCYYVINGANKGTI